ncbi:MAG: hypothetical protein JWP74_1580 [Marmoricola sp.]|nr:hypothetical protein [Marmoricola sp.]
MSYDLAFWRDSRDIRPEPQATYQALVSGESVDGIDVIGVDQILLAILATFPEAVREPNGEHEWVVWESPTDVGMFEVVWSDKHVLVSLRGAGTDTVNAIIDVCISRGTRLYDPQTDERFDRE